MGGGDSGEARAFALAPWRCEQRFELSPPHTACQVPAVVTLSHGTQSHVPVSLVPQSWSLPPLSPHGLCILSPCCGAAGTTWTLARWMVWADTSGFWTSLVCSLRRCQWWPPLLPRCHSAFPADSLVVPATPQPAWGLIFICRIPGLGYPSCGWNYLLPRWVSARQPSFPLILSQDHRC